MSDIHHLHSSEIFVLRACHNDDATDLVAIGSEYSVDVLQIDASSCKLLSSFHIGARVTAIAWSPRTTSPSCSDQWTFELAAASADFALHLLTKSHSADEHVFPFGGGLSGHHGKVNDITFCGGSGTDSTRYVATVSDKMLMIWDLHPTTPDSTNSPGANSQTPGRTPSLPMQLSSPPQSQPQERLSPVSVVRPQPTAYVIAFSRPLMTVNSHVSTSKEFLVSDSSGSIFITDWRSDPEEGDGGEDQESGQEDGLDNSRDDTWHLPNLVELVDPNAHSESPTRHSVQWSGSAAWRKDTPDIIGSTYGSKFSIWDMSNLHGGKPSVTGTSFPEGGHRFRWCPTYPEIFAISSQSAHKGALIHVHNANFVHAQPTPFAICPRPHFVRDFDFLAGRGIPRIAASIGRQLVVFSIGVDS